MKMREKAQEIILLLEKGHTDAKTALHYTNPLEILVATILSAQTTDKTVNQVTKILFQKYHKPEDYANADLSRLEEEIKATGFYRIKAKYLKKTGKMLVKEFGSRVPKTMDELVKLPGVARKTGNIVLWNAYGIIEGIAVDTHVRRLAQRLGLSQSKDPDQIEQDMMKLFAEHQWPRITDLLIFHGRRICTARKPKCSDCVLNRLCPSAFKVQ